MIIRNIDWESYPSRVSESTKDRRLSNLGVDGLRVRAKASLGYELAPENPGVLGLGVRHGQVFQTNR